MFRNQRQKSYIDPKVQGALVRRFLLHWLLFVLTAFVLLCVWQVLVSGDPVNGFANVMGEVLTSHLPVFVALISLLPVFILDTVKLSNRFAGPVVRLRDKLSDVADGKPIKPLNLRKGDFWQELADNFNRAAERMSEKPTPQRSATRDACDEPAEVHA